MLISDVTDFLRQFAPPELAESWDNVGLLLGDAGGSVSRVMTCLTITPASAMEAIERKAELVVTHHPLPFRPLKTITTATPEGRLLWDLARHGISVYSPHTAFDSAQDGINRRLAEGLKLKNIAVLVPSATLDAADVGGARFGDLQPGLTLAELAGRVIAFLRIDGLHVVGDATRPVNRVAVACGSAGEFLGPAREAGCDCLVTGETRFHASLEAEATGMALVLAGHYATERFGVEHLAQVLHAALPGLEVWASQRERDPLAWQAK